jgi:hypothetical protein
MEVDPNAPNARFTLGRISVIHFYVSLTHINLFVIVNTD